MATVTRREAEALMRQVPVFLPNSGLPEMVGRLLDERDDAVIAHKTLVAIHAIIDAQHIRYRKALKAIVTCESEYRFNPLEDARGAVQHCQELATTALEEK